MGIPPGSIDTDGDGLSDYEEISGSVYAVVSRELTWPEAKADAELRGGHLATITSDEEHLRSKGVGPLNSSLGLAPLSGR